MPKKQGLGINSLNIILRPGLICVPNYNFNQITRGTHMTTIRPVSEATEIITGTPSAAAFTALRAIVDSALSTVEVEDLLRHTISQLKAWPAEHKVVRSTWDDLESLFDSRSWPLVGSLTIVPAGNMLDVHHRVPALLSSPKCSQLEKIDFPYGLGDEDLKIIVASRQATSLRALSIDASTLADDGFRPLAESTLVGQLSELDIYFPPGTVVDDSRGYMQLIERRCLTGLTHLSVSFPPEGFVRALNKHLPTKLESIQLRLFSSAEPILSELCNADDLLAQLSSLSLPSSNLGNSGVRRLVEGIGTAPLTHLDLTDNGIGPDGIESLRVSTLGDRLNAVYLGLNPLGPEGWSFLSDITFPALRTLCLDRTSGGDQGLSKLAKAGHVFRSLRVLHAEENDISGGGVQEFAALTKCDQLVSLSLDRNPLCGQGVSALANCQWLEGLTSLSLRRTQLDVAGVSSIKDAASLRALRSLILDGNDLEGIELGMIDEGRFADTLWELSLKGCSIGDKGVASLIGAKGLHNLRILRLNVNQIDDAGVAHLGSVPFASNLWILELSDNPFGDVGLLRMSEGSTLQRLHELRIDGTNVTVEVLEHISQKCPMLKYVIHHDRGIVTI
jgi:Ran GTPase-activating protein (RanGAP) involved in mRNA processing and transport